MSITHIKTLSSQCTFGVSRCDITPPVGIYHRFWGAAAHDQATGIHRPLTATVFLLNAGEQISDSNPYVFVALDHCLFRPDDMQELLEATSQKIEIEQSQIQFCFSHTHSGGHICKARAELPGGDMIAPYLDGLPDKIASAYRQAKVSTGIAHLIYATTSSDMGHNRDFWDEENQIYVCGFNPEQQAGLPVHVVRVENNSGEQIATIVQYPCHPTTLAWENTLISPDYIGALRETVEQTTGVPCIFLPAPCGDTGPKVGFVGDTEIADKNGRQLAHAALSALESMPNSTTEFHYSGPVISGATLGNWESQPQTEHRQLQTSLFRHQTLTIELPYQPAIPKTSVAEQDLNSLIDQEAAERAGNNEAAARKTRALAERQRRLLERTRPLPTDDQYPFTIHLWQLGDAFWIALEGEPYHFLQNELMRRFPDNPLIIIPLANGARCSYLPTREAYEKPLYQVEVALLAPGCLEAITDAISTQIQSWLTAE